MTREQRLRRCLLVCCHFARNLAYYRARRQSSPGPAGDFWISADANFLDVAVMEWCKVRIPTMPPTHSEMIAPIIPR